MAVEEIDIEQWVESADNQTQKEFREAVHTILAAIAQDSHLRADMVLKGGILLAIRYHSHRYTKDIDLSTERHPRDGLIPRDIRAWLTESLTTTVEALDYDLDCQVQNIKQEPKSQEDPSFPALKISIGYAYRGTPKHRKLQQGLSPTVVRIDYSLNEPIPNVDTLSLGASQELQVYALTDLIAEKLRALLQQPVRGRTRRQDIYDLNMILQQVDHFDDIEHRKILESLLEKARARGIHVHADAFDVPTIRANAAKGYDQLAEEVQGDLPDFNQSFDVVAAFYRSLPWAEIGDDRKTPSQDPSGN